MEPWTQTGQGPGAPHMLPLQMSQSLLGHLTALLYPAQSPQYTHPPYTRPFSASVGLPLGIVQVTQSFPPRLVLESCQDAVPGPRPGQ